MTTPARAALYLAQHLVEHEGKGWAVHNPHGQPASELPVIYGFNNGGNAYWLDARLIAEDGTWLGGHGCSAEGYMPADLGVLEGTRPDRHETFRAHYPDGYRMVFAGYDDVPNTPGLMAALDLARQNAERGEACKTVTPE